MMFPNSCHHPTSFFGILGTKVLSLSLSIGVYYLIAMALLFLGCKVPPDFGDLKIEVKNFVVEPVINAKITLYRTLEDFNEEKNPIREATLSNAQGQVNFFGLNEAGKYYADVVLGNQNNWEGKYELDIIITENGFNNQFDIIIFKNQTADLASAQGKGWKIKEVRLDGSNITSQIDNCLIDNVYRFFKGGKFSLEESENLCNPSDPILQNGSWVFNSDKTELTIEVENQTQTWSIVQIRHDAIRILRSMIVNGNTEIVEVWYETI